MNRKGTRTRSARKKSITKSNIYYEITNAAPILAINLSYFAHPPRLRASAVRFACLRGEALQ